MTSFINIEFYKDYYRKKITKLEYSHFVQAKKKKVTDANSLIKVMT